LSPRFFVDAPLAANTTLALPGAVAHHATRVLRLCAGDAVTLFDGRGGEYAATIESVQRDGVVVTVGAFDAVEREAPSSVTLAQAVIAADPMDWALRKAVELGAAALVPIVAARSNLPRDGERVEKRLAHWRQIAIAACEQCGRNRIPPVAAPVALTEWIDAARDAALLVPNAPRSLARLAREAHLQAVLVGPEGGFTDAELGRADRRGIARVHVGPRILRAETAAAAALATIAAVAGDAA
jgi:16S rRNA (uracil1498-N3)-methyltransferase